MPPFQLPEVKIPARQISLDPALAQQLIQAARAAATHSYAPFSHFPVGAALIMADDPQAQIITGTNIENSAYGETLCAERNAITTATAQGLRKISLIALTTPKTLNAPLAHRTPCGACRQVIQEFSTQQTLILIDGKDTPTILDLPRLLPHPFHLTSENNQNPTPENSPK